MTKTKFSPLPLIPEQPCWECASLDHSTSLHEQNNSFVLAVKHHDWDGFDPEYEWECKINQCGICHYCQEVHLTSEHGEVYPKPDPSKIYCCEAMACQRNDFCIQHWTDCPDNIVRLGKSGKLFLEAKNATYTFKFCPWCGAEIEENKSEVI